MLNIKLLMIVMAVLFSVQIGVIPAYAGNTAYVGGTVGGNVNFSKTCPTGMRITGIAAKTGTVIERIRIRCTKISAAGKWSGNHSWITYTNTSAAANLRRNQSRIAVCSQDKFVNGIHARTTKYTGRDTLRQFSISCFSSSASGQLMGRRETKTVTASGGGIASGWKSCPNNEIAYTMNGKRGWYVDQIRFGCKAGATGRVRPTGRVMPPRNPRITSPRNNNSFGNDTVSIRWQGVRGAKSYRACVKEKGTSQCMVTKIVTGTSASFRVSSELNALRGKKITLSVKSCAARNGANCNNNWAHVDAYIKGRPVTVTSPANGGSYSGTDRRPTFSWQPYSGVPWSGSVNYVIYVWGNGAPKQVFYAFNNSTSLRPPACNNQYGPGDARNCVNPAFQNPIRWSVYAYSSGDGRASQLSASRTLTLASSSFATVTAPNLRSPNNGVSVDTGSQLRWYAVANAGSYKVCFGLSPNGCNVTHTLAASNTSYALTSNDLKMFRNKTMYWAVQAIATGGTSVAGSARRNVRVAAGASASVSFSTLAPTFTHSRCMTCHNFMNTAISTANGTLGKHGSAQRFGSSVNPTNPGTACNACHSAQVGNGNWMVPIASHSFTNKSNAALCALTKALGSGAAVKHHLKQDPRIVWAINSASGNVADSLGKAPPGNISQWNTMVDQWVDGGMQCN